MRSLSFLEAVNEALYQEMACDERVFVFGEDVGKRGGDFGATQGLYERFGPKRALDTPLSEAAIAGVATGSAMAGLRPVAEIMFCDFATECYDQIVNQAAKVRYMYGGQLSAPLVIRMPCGAGLRAGPHHSQSPEAWFANFPGLKIVAPSTPAEAKGLLVSSIRDDDPVLFLENKALYGLTGEVPETLDPIPLGKADTKRPGRDVTIVAYMTTVHQALEAAEGLAARGVEAEVLDLRTIVPYDKEAILASVRRTGRCVVAYQAPLTGGFGAEIAAFVQEHAFEALKAPVLRVANADVPVPFSPVLEDRVLPSVEGIRQAVLQVVGAGAGKSKAGKEPARAAAAGGKTRG